MIISASRRTDIPAFHGDWFIQRVRVGYCLVANPFNPRQIFRVSLSRKDVDVFVFWSKNPRPFLKHLDELDTLGYPYYFLYTLNDYPPELEPGVPPIEERLETFKRLAARIGPQRVIWRYDPIILSRCIDSAHHRRAFALIARTLRGSTKRVIVSCLDFYRKTERRIAQLEKDKGDSFCRNMRSAPDFADMIRGLAEIARGEGMAIQSCAEGTFLNEMGIPPGGCIDADLIREVFGIEVARRKDPGQRPDCLCVISRDIGAPDTCGHGCVYCYSNNQQMLTSWPVYDPSAEMLWPTSTLPAAAKQRRA